MTNSTEAPALTRTPGSSRIGPMLVKLAMLAILDAALVFLAFVLLGRGDWLILAIVAVAGVGINWIYLSKRALPAKYITPGLVFLAIFQVFVILYTVYIAFTNYSTGHILTKDQAVESLLSQAQSRVPDSPSLPLTVVQEGDELGFLVTMPDGTAAVGFAESPLTETDAVFEDGRAVEIDGADSLDFTQILSLQEELFDLSVPVSDEAADGWLRTLDGRTAYAYESSLEYDEVAGTLTDTETGTVYVDGGEGSFVDEDGNEILPGWQVTVGFQNFERAFTESSIRGPLMYVLAWTFAFAFLSVFLTFALGVGLAIMFNDKRMRGRKIYRVIMVLPYAFPAFLGALIWAGMFSTSFGFINQVLLGGAAIPWLTDPTMAKVAVVLVNLWLGFPYMFLVATGALQAIPDDILEAARTDGANAWKAFRHIKLPLLMVSMAPILISAFAFNFNNFNVIYLVTGGGPRDTSADIPVGYTDILISLVYKVAFTGQSRDYGLASAFSIIIFILVAGISILSFRRTKVLEELN